jgi:plasmid stabilization system protein ParE
MAQVAWTGPALSELFNIATTIARHSDIRAEKFVDGAFDKTDRLGEHPHLGQNSPIAPEASLGNLFMVITS